MFSFLLQPWLCVEGAANANSAQAASTYLDLTRYQAVIPYVEIASFSGTGAALQIQTAPTQDIGFLNLLKDASGNVASYTTTGVQTLRAFRFSDAQLPPALHLRWNANGGSTAWSMTFRIVLGLLEWGSGASSL